jgi:tetratricopeptide (TPR) repeat protein
MLSLLLYILTHYFIWVVLSIIIYIYRHQIIQFRNGFKKRRDYLRFLKERIYNRYDVKARFELGLRHLRLGNYRDAVQLFKEALETDPENAELHFHLGIALQKLRDYPTAIAEFKSCLNLKKDYGSGQVLLKLGDTYRIQRDYPAALTFYIQMLKMNPYEGEALYKIGLIKYQLRSHEEAKKYFDRAITEIKALPKFRYKKDRIWLYLSLLYKLLLIGKS